MTISSQTTKIILLAAVLALGIQSVLADSVFKTAPANPPGSNADVPINVGSTEQTKLGTLQVNSTTAGPNWIGLTVGQGIKVSSVTPNYARIYLDEWGDAAGHWSGIELRKNYVFQGGLFKRGDPVEANNDISIWNKTKPVLTVKQSGVTEFTSTVKIAGGSPAAGKVLVSDAAGLATWKTPSGASVSLGPVKWFRYKKVGQTSWSYGTEAEHIAAASCPEGWLMTGFEIYEPNIHYQSISTALDFATQGATLYCREIIRN